MRTQGGSQISTRKEDIAGGRTVLPTMGEGLEIELSDFEAENVRLKGDYLSPVVENVIEGIPTVLQVGFRCFFMSLGRILLQGSVLTDLFSPIGHEVDLRKV
jgi:hypothetical protein